ncbi:MAG TPA: hypothetical protein VG819_08080 [Rhizomicrobium sp.]|jgi:hypothetical protein|nr:hypothetical protein [Rhizomicrobium sp.]
MAAAPERRTSAMHNSRRAAIAMLVLGLYLEAMEWIDLYSWNNIRGGNGQESLDYILAGIFAVLVILLWRGGRIAALLALAFTALWGWLQISTWWIPYIQGASPGWKKTYAHWFAECVQILPATPDRLPPDANHVVLQVLVLIAFVASAIAAVSAFRDRSAS